MLPPPAIPPGIPGAVIQIKFHGNLFYLNREQVVELSSAGIFGKETLQRYSTRTVSYDRGRAIFPRHNLLGQGRRSQPLIWIKAVMMLRAFIPRRRVGKPDRGSRRRTTATVVAPDF